MSLWTSYKYNLKKYASAEVLAIATVLLVFCLAIYGMAALAGWIFS